MEWMLMLMFDIESGTDLSDPAFGTGTLDLTQRDTLL